MKLFVVLITIVTITLLDKNYSTTKDHLISYFKNILGMYKTVFDLSKHTVLCATAGRHYGLNFIPYHHLVLSMCIQYNFIATIF